MDSEELRLSLTKCEESANSLNLAMAELAEAQKRLAAERNDHRDRDHAEEYGRRAKHEQTMKRLDALTQTFKRLIESREMNRHNLIFPEELVSELRRLIERSKNADNQFTGR
jgi:Mg2+ and Co2+ transporter CorA